MNIYITKEISLKMFSVRNVTAQSTQTFQFTWYGPSDEVNAQ